MPSTSTPPLTHWPTLDAHFERLSTSMMADIDELTGLDPAHLLFVAVSAHGTATASVRSFDDTSSQVIVDGHRRFWEVALRPRFFFEGDPSRRVATLLHELMHLDPTQPGRLLDERRHHNLPAEELDDMVKPIARRFLDDAANADLLFLGHHGLCAMRQWRVRPSSATAKRGFDDDDLFVGPLLMETVPESRTVWW